MNNNVTLLSLWLITPLSASMASIGPFGGTISSLAVDPSNSDIVYAATIGGGVFKSTDGSVNWTAANAGVTNLDVRSLALAPAHPEIIYASTGRGAFKSTDGGSQWSPLMTGLTGPILSLAIDPIDEETIYAGSLDRGMAKSTDGGANWFPIGPPDTFEPCLGIAPSDSQIIYAGTSEGVFKSSRRASS